MIFFLIYYVQKAVGIIFEHSGEFTIWTKVWLLIMSATNTYCILLKCNTPGKLKEGTLDPKT